MSRIPAAAAFIAVIGLSACGSSSESTSQASPAYGSEGPASAEQLESCFMSQPGKVKLTLSPENGIVYTTDIDARTASGLVVTALIQNGEIDGLSPAEAVQELTASYGDAGTFQPYRSGTFVVYPNVRPYVMDPADFPELKPMLDACLPVTETLN